MSGIFDKLKDVGKDALGTFVVLDEDGNEQPANPADRTQPQPQAAARGAAAGYAAPPAGAAPQAPVAVPAMAVAPDPEFVQQLQASVDGSKKAAYTQFKALFAALSAVADEGTRTQLALSAAQASHQIGAAQVAEAIDDRLQILDGEKAGFESAVKEELEQSVGGMQAQIEKTRAEINKKIEEIKALETKAAQLDQEVREARAAIDANSARFAASYAAVQAELATERARITPFLTPAAK
ncbi:MAG TPA: hypothetical protein VF705_08680 [Longimicrobium sp.]